MNPYDDIINIDRPRSLRPSMPLQDRAAQFAPFAALSGHSEAVKEAGRIVEKRQSLSPEEQDELNRQIAYLRELLFTRPQVEITYFVADERKDGGTYAAANGQLRTIDDYNGYFVFQDGSFIPIKDTISLEFL